MTAEWDMATALKTGVLAVWLCLPATHAASAAAPTTADLEQLPQRWRDDEARDWDLRSVAGRPVVLTMAYASCHRICPMVIEQFRRLDRDARSRGQALEFVVVGYDPRHDDPAAWHRYRIDRSLTHANWHFITGSPADVSRLAHQLDFPFWTMDDHVMHDSRAVLFDARGRQRAALLPPLAAWNGVIHLSTCSEATCSSNF